MSDRGMGLKGRAGLSTPRAPTSNRALAWLAGLLADQRDRWILWLPAGAIAGAAVWLLVPSGPPTWALAVALIGGAALSWAFAAWPSARAEGWGVRFRAGLAGLCALVAMGAFGALSTDLRTQFIAAPRLEAPVEGARLEGWVLTREGGMRPRLRILVRSLEGAETPPRIVRISARDFGAIGAGRAVRCRVSLDPPQGPLAPGAYDFARRAYFQQLGAVGFVWGRCRPALFGPPPLWTDRAALLIGAVRADLSDTIREAAPGRGGDLAAALIAGDESAIDEETDIVLRDSGLGHLVSVSGLHMSIVGGLVFAGLGIFFSLIPPIALRVSVKKIAAVGALIALAAYLIVSGSSVPAIRAFVMACVAFGAVLIDRPAITMRGLSLAALIIVAIHPESVMEPGFQMSFAATAALVAAFEANNTSPDPNALPTPGPLIGSLQNMARLGGGVLLTSLVAGLATDPFALFHFQRFAAYGLIANLAIAPIVTFVVAPAAAAAALAAPFGLADYPLGVMAQALDLVAAIGESFGTRPEAVQAFPRPPDVFLPLSAMAITWACLWRGALRWGGLVLLGAAAGVYLTQPRATLAFDGEMQAVFMHQGDAWRLSAGAGRSTFARDRLGGQLGINPGDLARIRAPDDCTDHACSWETSEGRAVYLVRDDSAFAAACAPDALVLSPLAAPTDFAARCRPALLVDAASLERQGGGVLTEQGRSLVLRRATEGPPRPWTAARAN